MRTKKETLKSVKRLYEGLQKDYEAFRTLARRTLSGLRYPLSRRLLSVDAADAQGKLNGMTIVELITIANLTNGTGERLIVEAQGKTIVMFAEKTSTPVPMEMLTRSCGTQAASKPRLPRTRMAHSPTTQERSAT